MAKAEREPTAGKNERLRVYSVVSRKGGVGKTSTAHALGAGLIREGFRVLYIDLDGQHNLTHTLGADGARRGAWDVMAGFISAPAAIVRARCGDILTGSEQMAAADAYLTGKGKEYRLRDALRTLEGLYDYVIIDTPATLGTPVVNALAASDGVIIPLHAEEYSLTGLGQLVRNIDDIRQKTNTGLQVVGVLVTRYNGRSNLSRDMLANLQDICRQLGINLFTPIRECIKVKEAQAMKQDIYAYAPRSNAAKDYFCFLKEFLTYTKEE